MIKQSIKFLGSELSLNANLFCRSPSEVNVSIIFRDLKRARRTGGVNSATDARDVNFPATRTSVTPVTKDHFFNINGKLSTWQHTDHIYRPALKFKRLSLYLILFLQNLEIY